LERRVAELEAQVRDLLARLKTNASNSSLPPSANPPQATKPVVKQPTGRKPGGQPGHTAQLRQRLPTDRVTQVIPLIPSECQYCGTPLPGEAGPNDSEPTWHQVVEMPPLTAEVKEYQGHARTCLRCGKVTRAPIPSEIRSETIGPKLTGFMSYLSGCHHISRRGVEEIVEAVLNVPVSLGTVANLEQEMSEALAPAYQEAQAAVQAAAVKNVDETGWKEAGKTRWLWAAATATVAVFLIHSRRNFEALTALLGTTIHGIICSDRWGTYNRIATYLRQLCWSHLKRDFQKLVDRGGAAEEVGRAGLEVVRLVFEWWHAFRGGGIDRAGLQVQLAPVQTQLHALLESGSGRADKKTAKWCRKLLKVEPALWTFVTAEGVEPTNNHAERVQRRAVLWRKNSYGSHSADGCRFTERILTVVQTLRLQQRPVLAYLSDALAAHRHGLPAPGLLVVGP
jgi:transposase